MVVTETPAIVALSLPLIMACERMEFTTIEKPSTSAGTYLTVRSR